MITKSHKNITKDQIKQVFADADYKNMKVDSLVYILGFQPKNKGQATPAWEYVRKLIIELECEGWVETHRWAGRQLGVKGTSPEDRAANIKRTEDREIKCDKVNTLASSLGIDVDYYGGDTVRIDIDDLIKLMEAAKLRV